MLLLPARLAVIRTLPVCPFLVVTANFFDAVLPGSTVSLTDDGTVAFPRLEDLSRTVAVPVKIPTFLNFRVSVVFLPALTLVAFGVRARPAKTGGGGSSVYPYP